MSPGRSCRIRRPQEEVGFSSECSGEMGWGLGRDAQICNEHIPLSAVSTAWGGGAVWGGPEGPWGLLPGGPPSSKINRQAWKQIMEEI